MLIECVPNVSEGRDPVIINEVRQAIERATEVFLLGADSSVSANRTVLTFVGEPEVVLAGAKNLYRRAASLIDMRKQRGEHPRIGAVDVCPFVPFDGATIADCIELCDELARFVSAKLEIPVILYGKAAKDETRSKLSYIRAGGYERLRTRLESGEIKLDYPSRFNETFGVTIIGAREILIAFNINLTKSSLEEAKEIARQICSRRDRNEINDVMALGWEIKEYGCNQVSLNLLNYREFGLVAAYNLVKEIALNIGCDVSGSEIVGLVPGQALLAASYEICGVCEGACQEKLIKKAIEYLNLNDKRAFDPKKQIIPAHLERRGV